MTKGQIDLGQANAFNPRPFIKESPFDELGSPIPDGVLRQAGMSNISAQDQALASFVIERAEVAPRRIVTRFTHAQRMQLCLPQVLGRMGDIEAAVDKGDMLTSDAIDEYESLQQIALRLRGWSAGGLSATSIGSMKGVGHGKE